MRDDDASSSIVRRPADAEFDETFVLRTNAIFSPLETMLRYKHLWTVEARVPNLEKLVRHAPDLP